MYLAGYGVECMLKWYLISVAPGLDRLAQVSDELQRQGGTKKDICGAAGHDIPHLLALTGLEAQFGPDHKQWMGICGRWRSDWRYDPAPANRENAEQFVRAARSMTDWIQSRI